MCGRSSKQKCKFPGGHLIEFRQLTVLIMRIFKKKKEILWLLLICLEEKYQKNLKSSSGAGEQFIWQMVFVLCQFLP